MKIFAGIVMMGLISAMVLVATVIQLLIELSPYLLVAAVVFAILRSRRAHDPTRSVVGPATRPTAPARPVAPPSGGWILVPMWCGPVPPPRPRPTFIDAEVIEGWETRP